MAYRYGDRSQAELFPSSIEDYVPADDPVRVYDAFVDTLDFAELGISYDESRVGNSSYDPRAMLKLLVYGYSYGIRSSRKLERETHYNLSFLWLLGGLKPDHKTIAEFRRRHKSALHQVLKQCARLCLKLGVIAGNTLFVDGSKMRANASLSRQLTTRRGVRLLQRIDQRINEILRECDAIDTEESSRGSLVKLHSALCGQKQLRNRVQTAMRELAASERLSVNTTDPDCSRIRGRQGSHAGYNMQVVVDEAEGLIVSADVVSDNNDLGQAAKQIAQAEETLPEPCRTVCADAGYANYEELERLSSQRVIVPSKRQASTKAARPFAKSEFLYEGETDTYRCPTGHTLRYCGIEGGVKKKRMYRAGIAVCRQCRHFDVCTSDRTRGRKIIRYWNEDFRERLEREYASPESQEIYRLRKQKCEAPFGHIKRNLQAGHFLLRGLAGVRAEAALLGSCFNIRRLITLFGTVNLLKLLTA